MPEPISASLALTGNEAPAPIVPPLRDSQTTSFSGNLSPSDLAATRAYLATVKGFDLAAFDAAAKADGLSIPAGVDANGAAIGATAGDYRPSWPSSIQASNTAESLSVIQAQVGDFAASLQFDRGLGAGVIEHIADIGPRLHAMSLDEKVEWKAQQHNALVKKLGAEGLAAMKRKVETFLANSSSPFGKELSKATVLDSAWLLQTLHAQIAALGK